MRAEVSRHLAAELLYAPDAKLRDFQFIDAGGRHWRTEKYFNMLGRTLLHNNARECYLAGCAKGGSDIVTISVSGDCCDACGKYENALLSISGATPGLPTLQEAMDDGLFHPNCTHRIIAVPETIARKYYGFTGGNGKKPEPEKPKEPEKEKKPEPTYTAGEQKALEYAIGKIGDAKREHLLVFDSHGKVEYEETGKKRHVGYSPDEISYEGKIAIHNHPEGVFPYFSQQDLDTFHSKKIRMAATVSKDYIITIKKDENYPHEQSKIDITNGRDFRNSTIKEQISETYRQLRNAKSKAEHDELREHYIQLKLQYQADMAAEAGYNLRWIKRDEEDRDNFKFLDMLFGKSAPEKQVPEPAFDIKGMRGIAAQTRLLIGNDNVNLEGITNEALANQMNYALHHILTKYPQLKLTGVETDRTLKDNEPMAMTHTNTLLIRPNYFNGLLELMKDVKVENGKYDLPGLAAMYKGHEVETLIYHECGHALYNRWGLHDPQTEIAKEKKKRLTELFAKAKEDKTAKSLSDYALTTEKEFLSEFFTAIELDRPNIPEYIKAGIAEIMKDA